MFIFCLEQEVIIMEEPQEKLSHPVVDLHRAITSLREELEAVDFYNQRAEECTNEELRQILIHNRDEEKEHAAMLLEWIRRNDDAMSHELKDWLFTEKQFKHD